MARRLGLVVLLAVVATSRPARASFHAMNVVEVFPGTAAEPQAQYIVLQMWDIGQTFVNGHQITVHDSAGGVIGTYTFQNMVSNGANQATILIATAQAQSFFNVTADLTMTPTMVRAGGKVCFSTIDCVAWGTYSVTDSTVGTPFNSAAAPINGQPVLGLVSGKALKRRLDIAGGSGLDFGDDTDNSANDFVLGAPLPRNNAGISGTIPPASCGNGSIEGLEGCDDNGTAPGDGCSMTCVVEVCGDATVNLTGEVCDDGNRTNGDGCDNNCTNTGCGNGIRTGTEVCDDGNTVSGDNCDSNCTPTGCGNGVQTSGEGCDDGNATSGDGCDINCTPTGCGNGVVTTGEACEPPNQGTCDASCQMVCAQASDCADTDPCTTNERCVAPACLVDPTPTDDSEPCTVDGCNATGVFHSPLVNGTTCVLVGEPTTRALCVTGTCVVARCGDGYIDANAPTGAEECDDGNTVNDDACSNACKPARCGDAIVQAGEGCDDGGTASNDGCTSACQAETCGDAIQQPSEMCDDGNAQPNDGCSAACLHELCGDGIVQTNEECDDMNAVDEDGCAICRLGICGDGIVQRDETCDDGNQMNGDACPNTCGPQASGCCGVGGGSQPLLALFVLGALLRRRRRHNRNVTRRPGRCAGVAPSRE